MSRIHKGISPDIDMRFCIMHAVDQPLDRISVTRICKNAGISRDTFYRYFDSKFDIPFWHGEFVQRFYLDEIGRTIDWRTGYFHDFRMLAEETDFYDCAMPAFSDCLDSVKMMEEHRKQVILETLHDWRHHRVDDDLMFCVKAFVRLETELVADWLAGGFEPSPEVFAARMLRVVPGTLFDAMQLPTRTRSI